MGRSQYLTQTPAGARFLVFPDDDAIHTVSRMLLTLGALSIALGRLVALVIDSLS